MSEKIVQIRKALQENPEGLTPKIIALKTGINVNTVKSLLPKMTDIKKPFRGLYKVADEGDGGVSSFADLSSWNFHNLVLSCSPSPSLVDSPTSVFDWGLVRVSFSFSSRQCTCRLSSDFPLNVSSICFVAGLFADRVGVSFGDVMVSTVEFNRDFSGLRLDGVNCISVSSLVDQFKVYQKASVLRVEHKTSVPFGVQNIVDMLSHAPLSSDVLQRLCVVESLLSDSLFVQRDVLFVVKRLLSVRGVGGGSE